MAVGKNRRAGSADNQAEAASISHGQVRADGTAQTAGAAEPGAFTPLSDGSYLDDNDPSKKKIVYEKVTAEDMKRQMDRKRELRQQRRKEREAQRSPVFSVARIGVTAVTLLGAVGSLLYVAGTSGSYDEQYRANAEQISELSSRNAGLDNDARTQLQPSVIRHDLDLASERGQMIADIQNQMANTRLSLDMDDDARDKQIEVYSTQVDQMRSMIAKESTAGGDFAPQQRWIAPIEAVTQGVPDDPETAPIAQARNVPADQYTWTVHATRSIDTDSGVVPIIWTAHRTAGDDAGQLIAWTKALFDPDTGMFSAFDFGLTPYGETLRNGTPSVETQDKIADEQMLKRVQEELDRARGLQQEQDLAASKAAGDAKQQGRSGQSAQSSTSAQRNTEETN